MKFDGVLITGTSGSGKTSISLKFVEMFQQFEIAKAITTRNRRSDDFENQYDYVSIGDFSKIENNEFIIKADYRGHNYGIRFESIASIVKKGKLPIIIITPESTCRFLENQTTGDFLSIFVDCNDEILDQRLRNSRGILEIDKAILDQREKDRKYATFCHYNLFNIDNEPSKLTELVYKLWTLQNRGGVLPKNIIKSLISFQCLLGDASIENVSSASYDLSLGDEYYYRGKILLLSEANPFILIDPYDYAIVTSKETSNLPLTVSGRFDLCISLFCQGIILSNGPQIDPGFKGKLFCLLFNTSNSPVVLKRMQHYATIEFNKLIEPTEGYVGKYQNQNSILSYLPTSTLMGGVSELKKELEEIKKGSENLQSTFLAVISLILALIAIILVL